MKVNILKFDHFGRGIAKVNEKIVFVERALPSETIDINIVNSKNKYSEGINIMKQKNLIIGIK